MGNMISAAGSLGGVDVREGVSVGRWEGGRSWTARGDGGMNGTARREAGRGGGGTATEGEGRP